MNHLLRCQNHALTPLLLLFAMFLVFGCDDTTEKVGPVDVAELAQDTVADEDEVKAEVNDTYDPFGDSDGDGLADYLEDANGNGVVDVGETDPNNPDTDNDGLADGVEDANQNGYFDVGETNPLSADSDGDGLIDGVEDANVDGVWEPASGETDPLSKDSDDDGINDNIEVNSEVGLDPNNPDSDDDHIADGVEDLNKNGIYEVAEGETNPTSADTDDDGLGDGCEDFNANGLVDAGESDPRSADTDGDGLNDGDECEALAAGQCPNFDNVGNCATNPTLADTDGDGLNDLTELISDYGGGISTDPRNPDTDGDLVPDGLEDFNQNGHYDPSLGELNPIDPMSDGTTPDGQRPQAQACLSSDMPAVLASSSGDFRYAYNAEMEAAELTFTGAGTSVAGWILDHPSNGLAGFVIAKRPSPTATNALEQERLDAAAVGGQTFFPRAFTTWDGYDARITTYRFTDTGTTRDVRNGLIADLTGVNQTSITGLTNGGLVANNFELNVLTVYRSSQRVLLVGVVMANNAPPADEVNVRSISLTNGTGLAAFADDFAVDANGGPLKACNIFRVTELPIVDFLFVIDDTGSMAAEQQELQSATEEIFTAIQSSFISARWTITSTEVGTGDGSSYGMSVGWKGGENHCGLLSHPKGPNGIIWAPFTQDYKDDFECRVKDPLGDQDCDPNCLGPDFYGCDQPGYAEYGLLCSKWAIDYFQGRRGTFNPNDLQRPRSELVVIIITDECEGTFCEDGSEMSVADIAQTLTFFGVSSWSGVTRALAGQKFIDFYKSIASTPPYGAATPFLIYSKPSGPSDLDDYLDPVYFEFLDKDPNVFPNGASMDIRDITQIPEFVQKLIRAANGLASAFEPRYVPITANMKAVVQRAFTTNTVVLDHSLVNGWNYDPVANSMVFFGENRPKLLDSFAINYAYWVSAAANP